MSEASLSAPFYSDKKARVANQGWLGWESGLPSVHEALGPVPNSMETGAWCIAIVPALER